MPYLRPPSVAGLLLNIAALTFSHSPPSPLPPFLSYLLPPLRLPPSLRLIASPGPHPPVTYPLAAIGISFVLNVSILLNKSFSFHGDVVKGRPGAFLLRREHLRVV